MKITNNNIEDKVYKTFVLDDNKAISVSQQIRKSKLIDKYNSMPNFVKYLVSEVEK